jgi:hypothetical protein
MWSVLTAGMQGINVLKWMWIHGWKHDDLENGHLKYFCHAQMNSISVDGHTVKLVADEIQWNLISSKYSGPRNMLSIIQFFQYTLTWYDVNLNHEVVMYSVIILYISGLKTHLYFLCTHLWRTVIQLTHRKEAGKNCRTWICVHCFLKEELIDLCFR